jgi:oligosaccharide repeat unit polymerase
MLGALFGIVDQFQLSGFVFLGRGAPRARTRQRANRDFGAFFSSRAAISAAKSAAGLTKAQSGLFVTGAQALVLFVCVSAILLRKKNPKDPIANVSLVISGIGLLILGNPLSSSRFWFFTVITTLALTTLNLTPGRIRFGSLGLFFGTMFIFPLADYFRRADHTFGSIGSSAWLTGDFDALQITGAGIQWFTANGAVWGHQLLGAIFPVVPRSIWTGKPIDTGIMIARDAGMKFDNISGPWVAEGVINFGYIGVLIFPLMIAFLFRAVKFRAELFPDDFGIILNGFLVGYLPILMRGSLIQASGAAGLFTIYVWYASPKERKKTASKAGVPVRSQPPSLQKVA